MIPSYQLMAIHLRGQPLPMADYVGRVVLAVDTASHCGFTSQYAGLEMLYKKYATQGLVVFGFPCNQFGKQEPDGADEIEQTYHVDYGVSFPMLEKVDVNGPAAHPLLHYLKQALLDVLGEWIKWSFTKFLVARDGTPLTCFAPLTTLGKMEASIATALTR